MKLLRRISTIDPSETFKFSQYKWWNEKNALHPFADLRIEYIKKRLGVSNFSGLKILDIGCGGGIMTERLGRLGGEVLGIDPSQEAINTALDHLPSNLKSRVSFKNCEIPEVDGKYDIVLASEVIEHVNDPQQFLKDLSEKVNDSGSVFITTVSRNIESWVLGILISEYVLGIVEPGTHKWEKFINPEELSSFCKASGLEIADQQGWILNLCSFKASFTSHERLGYLAHCLKTSKNF
jgi:polyprenyldihydroxybenzoate methyltransferase / 3-demethylubiquinol 3-O-methyltransferase